LLPHAFLGEHAEENAVVVVNNQKNVLIGLGIFVGLFFFFFMDKMMRVFNGGSGHSHGHEHEHTTAATTATEDKHDHSDLRQRTNKKNDDETTVEKKNKENGIKLSAYLNLLADFTHNMTDGLAMAASFYASPAVGATTAVAVFFHEIPHEVGDYAILIQSGFSKQKAMMAQFTTAIGAFLGTFIGILIEESSLSNKAADEKAGITDVVGLMGTDLRWGDLVIPFAAGGFMYIATVGVIPELLEVTGNIKKDRKQAITEFLAMFVGLGLMLFIAWNDIPA
jgi:zinc transporter 7